MKLASSASLLVSLFASVGFGQDVRYNCDHTANFSQYRTYKWVDVKDAAKLNQLADQQIKSTIEAELAKKGFTRVEDDKADLYIAYQAAVNQEKQYSSYSTGFDSGWGYGPGWRGWGGPGMSSSTTTTSTDTIHIGTVALDMYDSSRKQLVWRGEASKTLDEKAKPEKRQKNLTKGIAKLLKNYPPPVK